MQRYILPFILFVCTGHMLTSCKRPASHAAIETGYPEDINKIVTAKCATSGCHDQSGYAKSGGLRLDTWEHLFNGGITGAAVVAYNTENSPLLYYLNTDSAVGMIRSHNTPLGKSVTKDEYTALKTWIANGAPDKKGNIPFADNPDTRQKIYLAHGASGNCKLLAVIDAEKKVVMRYVPIGVPNLIESAHNIRVSPDGKYAYLCFIGSSIIQKVDTRIDKVVGSINVGVKQWGVINMSADGKKLMVDAWQADGELHIINTETMTEEQILNTAGMFTFPHGIISNNTFDTFYVTSLYGNVVYKLSANMHLYKQLSLDSNPCTFNSVQGSTPDPHDIAFTPDHSRYLVTCQNTNEVRVFDTHADTLLKVIPVGMMPQHIAVSKSTDYAIIACMSDDDGMNGMRYMGSVYVINYKTLQVVKKIQGQFSEPHSVLADDLNGVFYIMSRNSMSTPVTTHESVCGDQNGWYSVYSLSTLQPVANKFETVTNPYFADTRFK